MAYVLGRLWFLQLPRELCSERCSLLLPVVFRVQDHLRSLAAASSVPRKFCTIYDDIQNG